MAKGLPSVTCLFRFYFLGLLKKRFFFSFNVYFSERETETESEQGRSRERERETQNLRQSPGSELSAQSPTWGLNPQTVRSWPELKSDT